MQIYKLIFYNSQFSYTNVVNINLLAVVTPPSIYHGCSTQKTFWEEKSTLSGFITVNIICFGCRNVMKHKEIDNGEKYITLDISLEFGYLEKIKIISSEPNGYLGRSVKGLITSMGIKTIVRSNKNKNKVCHY